MNWFESFWKTRSLPVSGGGIEPQEAMSNFTPRAQQVLALARKEADRFNHNFVGTEHLLLGLIALGQGTAVKVLENLGPGLDVIRAEVEKQVGTGPEQKVFSNIPYTPRVKTVLALAQREAKSLGHTYVGTEHILLGLLREGDGVASRVLQLLNVDLEKVRMEILRELNPNSPPTIMKTNVPEIPDDSVDVSRRYDVYCSERNDAVIVYRNALFKGRRKLLSNSPHDLGPEFLELEQSNGQTVFVSAFSVFKFTEPGAEIVGQVLPAR